MKINVKQLLWGKTNKVMLQLFRYTFVGGFAFAVDFGLLWLFTEICGLYYMVSATLSFLTGLCVNYFISIKLVFFESRVNNRKLEFIFVAFIGLVGVLLNAAFIWFFTEITSLHYLLSKIISAVIVYLWNFFARRYLIFSQSSK
ncbi:MAG: GtrA family protein [Bacteroidales bacterium]|jgi:putative flippase GtrA|nr:GtrA family protein [Bacteroidales bacterium]